MFCKTNTEQILHASHGYFKLNESTKSVFFFAATSAFRKESRNPNFETAHSDSPARTSEQDLTDS